MPLWADRLKERRQLKGFTQQDFARQIGVTQQQVARWEKGTSDASADSIARIAQTLDCTADWLLGLVKTPYEHRHTRELSDDERQLIELYRQQKLPQMISQLVNQLARANPAVDDLQQPEVAPEEKAPDG